MRFILFLFTLSCFTATGQVLRADKKPMICGHRGGFYDRYPENSLAVMEYVTDQVKNAPVIIEVDVRKSKDGTLYILHDEQVDRTTSGTGKISVLSDAYLQKLRLKKNAGELSDQRILSLRELLDSLSSKNVWLMLDIKEDAWIETAKLILQKGWDKRSLFLTFKPSDTKRLYDYSSRLMISALLRNETDWAELEKQSLPASGLIAYILRDATKKWSDQLKKAGFAIMADASEHTTNQGQLYEEAYYRERITRNDLDILITDFPIEVAVMLSK